MVDCHQCKHVTKDGDAPCPPVLSGCSVSVTWYYPQRQKVRYSISKEQKVEIRHVGEYELADHFVHKGNLEVFYEQAVLWVLQSYPRQLGSRRQARKGSRSDGCAGVEQQESGETS